MMIGIFTIWTLIIHITARKFWKYDVELTIVLSVASAGMLLTSWVVHDDWYGSHSIQWLVYKPSDKHTEYIIKRNGNSFPMIKVWKGSVLTDSETESSLRLQSAESESVFSLCSSELCSSEFERDLSMCIYA